MTARSLSRRDLIASAIGLSAAQLITNVPALAAGGRSEATAAPDAVIAACVALGCPASIRDACRRALGSSAGSATALQAVIRRDLSSAGLDCSSSAAIRHALREQSRRDFAAGNVVDVEGWMLSVTETRAYALAAILA